MLNNLWFTVINSAIAQSRSFSSRPSQKQTQHWRGWAIALLLTVSTLGIESLGQFTGYPNGVAIAAPTPNPPPKTADDWLREGARQSQQRQWAAATESWQQALKLYQQQGNRTGEGRVLGNLAGLAVAQGQYPDAIALFQQSLAIARAQGDAKGESFALTNLGLVYRQQGDDRRAIQQSELALPIARNIGDREGEGDILNQLGILQRRLGNYERAIAYLQQSLQLAQTLKHPPSVANALGNLANTHVEQGNYAVAVQHYQAALPLMREIGDPVGEAGILQRLGGFYAQIGNRDRAVTLLTQSLDLARKIGDRPVEAYALSSLGSVAYQQDQPQQALKHLQAALAIVEALGDRAGVGKLQHTLGNAYVALNQYDAAQSAYDQSLAIARELGYTTDIGVTQGALAILAERQKQPQAAIQYYEQAIATLRKVGDRPRLGTALSNLGMAWFAQGNLEAAETRLLEAIAVWESLRPGLPDTDQISLLDTQADTYRALQRVQILRGRSIQALETSERGRARAFLELVARRYSAQAAQRLQLPPPTADQLRQIAREQRATLVEYAILDRSTLGIWVVQPSGDIHFRQTTLPEAKLSLTETVEQSRIAAVMGRGVEKSRPRPNAKLLMLHQVLIQPIAAFLPTDPNAEVIIIPQGSLFLVPFVALQDENRNFLIERHTLRTAPSIQVLQLTRQRRSPSSAASNRRALIVGNPTMPAIGSPPEPLTPLPFAEKEAVAIAELLKTTAIVGQAATEPAIVKQMQSAQILHFATHGLLDDLGGAGIPGALALAPTLTSDGLLTSDELLNMTLQPNSLVVLSACDTGRGRITEDGVVGLARSLISAGAPSVVVSLWAVPDDSTADLMTEFYKNLLRYPSQAQALRQAMLSTMQRYPSSRDWAAFTLMGES